MIFFVPATVFVILAFGHMLLKGGETGGTGGAQHSQDFSRRL
jgi:hypothetical protein